MLLETQDRVQPTAAIGAIIGTAGGVAQLAQDGLRPGQFMHHPAGQDGCGLRGRDQCQGMRQFHRMVADHAGQIGPVTKLTPKVSKDRLECFRSAGLMTRQGEQASIAFLIVEQRMERCLQALGKAAEPAHQVLQQLQAQLGIAERVVLGFLVLQLVALYQAVVGPVGIEQRAPTQGVHQVLALEDLIAPALAQKGGIVPYQVVAHHEPGSGQQVLQPFELGAVVLTGTNHGSDIQQPVPMPVQLQVQYEYFAGIHAVAGILVYRPQTSRFGAIR